MDVCFDLCVEQLLTHPKLRAAAPVQDRSGNWLQTYVWEEDGSDELRLVLGHQLPSHILARVPFEIQRVATCIARIEGTALDRLTVRINEDGDESTELNLSPPSVLSWLSYQLNDSRTWALSFEWHCDTIDEVFSASTTETLNYLASNLKWDRATKGFVAYHLAT